MGELYNPFPKLPKNIRQIGERDQIVKLYVEDYVNTYLRRLYPMSGQDLRVGLLLGSLEMNDGTPYIFIDGAMEMEGVAEQGGKVAFSETAWEKACQCAKQLFPKRSIQGWFLRGASGDDLSPLNYWKQHVQYFPGVNKLMYIGSGAEGDETVYITSEDGFYKLSGYSIYYERNQMMQDYMVLRKDVKKIEAGSSETVIEEFRKRMDGHRDEAADRRQTLGLLRGMCMAMSIVILAGGIVMFNNYGKMQKMKSAIASAVPERVEAVLSGKNSAMGKDKPESHVVIEEADGGVNPTALASVEETQSQVQPETKQEEQPQTNQEEQPQTNQEGQPQTKQEGQPETKPEEQPQSKQEGQPQTKPEVPDYEGGQDNDAADKGQNAQGGKDGQPAKGTADASQAADEAAAPGTYRVHMIQEGETLYGICISEYHNINKLKEICELNGMEDENKIVAGQKLLLP